MPAAAVYTGEMDKSAALISHTYRRNRDTIATEPARVVSSI